MRLVEFEVSSVNTEKLAALGQFLLSRTKDTNAKKTMPVSSFLDLANNMGIALTDDQLRNIVQQPPLSEIIANIEGDAFVQTLLTSFDGTILPDSIQPLRPTGDPTP